VACSTVACAVTPLSSHNLAAMQSQRPSALGIVALCLALASHVIEGVSAAGASFRRFHVASSTFNAKVQQLRSTLLASQAFTAKAPAGKVEHLVADVEESVRKADEEAQRVFSTLDMYDQKFESSLTHEIATLKRTLKKLASMQATYSANHNASQVKLKRLGAAVNGSQQMASQYVEGTMKTSNKFDGLVNTVAMLNSLLRNAAITPEGTLVTPEAPDSNGEPSRVFSAIRRLLAANQPLRTDFPDVFAVFVVPESMLQLRSRQGKVRRLAASAPVQDLHVRVTPALIQRTISALTKIESRLRGLKSQALLQYDTQHRHFEGQAVSAGATVRAQQGVEAENEQKSEELLFSIRFSERVLKLDEAFKMKLEEHSKSIQESVKGVHESRKQQLSILHDLAGVLDWKPAGTVSGETSGAAFLQVASHSEAQGPGLSISALQTVAGFQSEIETAIRKKADTHAILMRIQKALEKNEPVEAPKVQTIVSDMENSLRSMENDQTRMNEAKRGCQSQIFHATEEEQSLKANLALMTTALNHANAAIKAAKANIKDITSKSSALDASLEDFSQIISHSTKVAKVQGHDHNTIVMAIKKAIEVVGSNSAVDLMQTLLHELSAEEVKDHAYRSQLASFKHSFVQYVQDYKQLLAGRRGHYESSLRTLELHVSELDGDVLAQKQTLGTGQDLKLQSKALCDSITKFYDNHLAMLMDTMRTILLKMPASFVAAPE